LHGAASLLSDLRFLRHKGISSYFVTRNSIFVFTKPTVVYHILCRRIRIYTRTWSSWRYIFVFFFHILLGGQAAFCVRLFPLMHSMHFLSVLCHVLLITRKLTLSTIYVTWLPHFWTLVLKVRENSCYKSGLLDDIIVGFGRHKFVIECFGGGGVLGQPIYFTAEQEETCSRAKKLGATVRTVFNSEVMF
jgi:hypothetical protein